MRIGFTLIETVLVLCLTAILAGLALPALVGMRDRLTVSMAAMDTSAALSDARLIALAGARRTAVHMDATRNTITVVTDSDTLRTLHLDEYGVALRTTRDSIAFGPTGIGWGAATATITLTRGRASTAVAISRLGRIRRT